MEQSMTSAASAMEPTGGNDLLQMMQLAAANINGLSKQMGLVNARIDEHSKRIDRVEERVDKVESELTVNRAQANRLQSAIHQRVTDVLKLEFDGGKVADGSIKTDKRYRGGFISRCYTDARRKSKLGTPYYATLRCDFHEVMDYIKAWEPEVSGGVDGYKHYLDIRREERQKKQQ